MKPLMLNEISNWAQALPFASTFLLVDNYCKSLASQLELNVVKNSAIRTLAELKKTGQN